MLFRIILAVLIILAGYAGITFYNARQDAFALYKRSDVYVIAAPDSTLTVVEFLDYGCEPCRTLHPVMMEAMKADGKIRYIPVPKPSGGAWQARLVAAVYAAGLQGKFAQMHDAVISGWPVLTEERLFEVANTVGLDVKILSRDMSSPQILGMVQENADFYDLWFIRSVPSLVIGSSLISLSGKFLPTVAELTGQFDSERSKSIF